ncbi:MAG: hypothetical protein IJ010_01205 [Ruminococcus sp.]|nr:hypothetical protein [Ruminococcus sp.]
MNENKKETIDPVEFLAVYQKMQQLSPNALERVNGFIEGISAGFDIAVNQQEQKGA